MIELKHLLDADHSSFSHTSNMLYPGCLNVRLKDHFSALKARVGTVEGETRI